MQNKAAVFYATVFYNGGQVSYTFPFQYLSKRFVKVSVDSADESTLLVYNQDYNVEGNTLTLRQAPDADKTVCIFRSTPTGSLVDFNDGSILLASELDRMSMQLLHVTEENSDAIYLNGMFADDYNAWQGQGKRIKNISDPKDKQDVVTVAYAERMGLASVTELTALKNATQSYAEQVAAHLNEAQQEVNKAKTAATKSTASEQQAGHYAVNAEASAEAARESARQAHEDMEDVYTWKNDTISVVTSLEREIQDEAAEVKQVAASVEEKVQQASISAANAQASAQQASTHATKAAESAADAHSALLNILQRNKVYNVGDIAYSPLLASWARLECVKAGTTGAELPYKIEQTLENGGG